MGFEQVDQILSGRFPVQKLLFDPGDLVLFRGRNSIHRVTPTEGKITRMLVVFAFNDQPGIGPDPGLIIEGEDHQHPGDFSLGRGDSVDGIPPSEED